MTRRADERLVFAKVDGDISPADGARLEERLRNDDELRRRAEGELALVCALARLAPEEPPRDLVAGAQRQLRAEGRVTGRTSWSRLALLRAGLGAAVAAMVAIAFTAAIRRGGDADEATGQGEPGAAGASEFVVTHLSGAVWVTEGATRRAQRLGERLGAGARIESDAASSVSFVTSGAPTDRGATSVTLREGTSARLEAAGPSHLVWVLERGVLRAEVDSTVPLTLRIDTTAYSVEVSDGVIGALSDGTGSLSLACERGAATLRHAAGDLRVAAGYEIVATKGRLGAVSAVRDLVLEANATLVDAATTGRATPEATATRTLEVSGQTRPGVLLTVDGVPLHVDAEGRFAQRVNLSGSLTQIVVRARNAYDQRREVLVALAPAPPVRPSTPSTPRMRKLKSQWEWERSPG